MFGGASIQLARVLGIRIGVHPSWFVVLFLMIWSLSGLYEDVVGDDAFVLAALSAFLFFGSVVLHELGHAVVARRNGIETHGIDLWLSPPALGAAPRGLDSTGDPAFCTLWTYCGVPAITLPLLTGSNGMPIGVQLVGRRNYDGRLLRTAKWLEAAIGTDQAGVATINKATA